VFEDDFKKQHTPDWWKNLFESSGLLQVLSCQELEDAEILYEGLVLYNIEHGLDPEDVEISIAQLEYGREHRPRKSLFTITARKW
jgi:hypothetical protein